MRQIRTELLDQENDKSRGYVQIDTDWRFLLAIVRFLSLLYEYDCTPQKSKLIALKLFNTKTRSSKTKVLSLFKLVQNENIYFYIHCRTMYNLT